MTTVIELVVFDLDGVLTESRQPLSDEIAKTLNRLTRYFYVGIISGSRFEHFERSVIPFVARKERLLLSPTSGAALHYYEHSAWQRVIATTPFTESEYQEIRNAFRVAVIKSDVLLPQQATGLRVENRGEQITFSALGQDAPLFVKSAWDIDRQKRSRIVGFLKPMLPNYHLMIGGLTSIDVTHKHVHKGRGVEDMLRHLHLKPNEAVFFGDALEAGGNDYEVIATGVPCFKVGSPADTLRAVEILDRTPIRNL